MFMDEELDAMEEAFCNGGLTYLVDEIRRERRYREQIRQKVGIGMAINERYFYGAHGIDIEKAKQERIIGHCKDCKYFEYDSPAMVDGIPLIVAHEICSKWGEGCKTCEEGYCFMFEQRMESEVEQ